MVAPLSSTVSAGTLVDRQVAVLVYRFIPRGRGTDPMQPERHHCDRFIPARAGNASSTRALPPKRTVHPRLRGEHRHADSAVALLNGSSPPARGTRKVRKRSSAHLRFIPACAGNTRCRARGFPQAAVHPRLRGEHLEPRNDDEADAGSSPPARGTLVVKAMQPVAGRFIPACAGNTSRKRDIRMPGTVHPRLRGEHSEIADSTAAPSGSSPPARGTLRQIKKCGVLPRFIPACAGNTAAPTRRA